MLKNKTVLLAIIGVVLGLILGAVVNSQQANAATLAVVGGVVGFLAGWIWNLRSGGADDAPSSENDEPSSGGSDG